MFSNAFRFERGNVVYASVVIRCPIQKVFQFYCDFQNLPKFLGDVLNIEPIAPGISRWTIAGPLGIHGQWIVKVTDVRMNALICYETVTTAWKRARWEVHFYLGSASGETVVSEFLKLPLGWAGRSILAILGKSPTAEVPANLRKLKQILETSCATDMASHSVPSSELLADERLSAISEMHPSETTVDPEIAELRAALKEGWLFEAPCKRRDV